jgi:VWFA-related protein
MHRLQKQGFMQRLRRTSRPSLGLPILALFAAAITTAAQAGIHQPGDSADQSTSPAATLRTDTSLLLVDVVVREKGGAVHGIGKERFHVFEDGKEQPLVSVDEHRSASISPQALPPLPPNTYSNAPEYPQAAAVNVLLFDGLNTPMQAQMQTRAQMIEYLGRIAPGTPLALFTLGSQLRLVQGFTMNPGLILKAIKSPDGAARPSVILESPQSQISAANQLADIGAPAGAVAAVRQFEGDNAAFQLDVRVELTLDAMRQLGRYLSAIPGRKNLIWFSGSFPVSIDPDRSLTDPFSAMRDYAGKVQEASSLFAAARVAVYPIDARGIMNLPSSDASNRGIAGGVSRTGAPSGIDETDRAMVGQTVIEHTTMQQLATHTGGYAFINTNDFEAALAQAIAHGAAYYTIAYSPGSKTSDGKYHRIKVAVDQGAYELDYRRGYFAEKSGDPSTAPPPNNLIMEAAMRGAPPATQILFEARVLPDDAPEIKTGPKLAAGPAGDLSASLNQPVSRYVINSLLDAHTLAFNADPKGLRRCQVEVTLVAYDRSGKRLNFADRGVALALPPDLYQRRLETGIPARMMIDLPPGEVFLRIAVRDLIAGKIGSLEVPLQVTAK